MSYRTWSRLLLAALSAGFLAGAGQLGFAYGLGILRFADTFDPPVANRWAAQLAWVGWIAMVAAVTGALVTARLADRQLPRVTMPIRVALAGAAAIGAAGIAPLAMPPARAVPVTSVDAVLAVGLAAGLGAVVGLLAALVASRARPIGWNIAAVTGGVWFLALLSVLPSIGPSDPLPDVRLGGLDSAWLDAEVAERLALVPLPALALIAGAAIGALARWRGHPGPVVATSGIAGPALLALAYLTAGPGVATDRYQAAPYWAALIALGAGPLGSVLAAVVRWPFSRPADDQPSAVRPADPTPAGAIGPTGHGPGDAAETTPPGKPFAKALRRRAVKRHGRVERPVPAPDDEYIDWVSGLGVPGPRDAEPPSEALFRRSLRPRP